ncbi:MAG: PepSY domain-containing protein [Janthinobacterium lividum]
MTISIWRYSHLALAISSFLLLALASVTGIILAFEPISQKIQSPATNYNLNQITLAQAIPVLHHQYKGISELSVEGNRFVQIKGSDASGKNILVYVDPKTGKISGTPPKKSEFFQWVTTLHRSLFSHETGRFLIGLSSFLLLLITISGTILIIQRQRGVKRFFTKIARDNFAQYYHVVLGRLLLIPVIIIALSGTYLSLSRFGLIRSKKTSVKIDFDAIKSQPKRKLADFAVFTHINLAQVESIEFPFSEDAEDYYTLKLTDRELTVNQITGDILTEVKYPTAVLLTNLSLNLHTGRTNEVWAMVLAIASGNILFFIYSGFVITWKRIANRTKNNYTAAESRFIILVGSENGSTYRYANAVHQQLIKQGQKSFLTELNNYTVFPKAANLIVMTATYGLGEAPTNATKFTKLLEKYPQAHPVNYSVIGFGSHAYPDFCRFAFEVNQQFSQQKWAVPLVDIHTVADKSATEFNLWSEAYAQRIDTTFNLLPEIADQPKNLSKFKVIKTVSAGTPAGISEKTFLVRLQPDRNRNFTSGDLLAIYPANDYRERLYSIGKIEKDLQLCVKLHPQGLGSGYLSKLKTGDSISAKIINNEHFHFPKKATEVVMIANGSGIAPFLGMINQNTTKISCSLYCGFRYHASLELYHNFLEDNKSAQKLMQFHIAQSREAEKQYVSHLVSRDAAIMVRVLGADGVIMLCGSLAMQKDVLEILENICQKKLQKSISFYQSRNQILTDCY